MKLHHLLENLNLNMVEFSEAKVIKHLNYLVRNKPPNLANIPKLDLSLTWYEFNEAHSGTREEKFMEFGYQHHLYLSTSTQRTKDWKLPYRTKDFKADIKLSRLEYKWLVLGVLAGKQLSSYSGLSLTEYNILYQR